MLDLAALSDFHLLRPWWLLALPPLFWLLLFLRQHRDNGAQWRTIIAPHLLQALVQGDDQQRRFNPLNLAILTSLIGVLAMAGPSWQRQTSPLVQDESALVIVLDLSQTMNQTDIQPSRLSRAKQKIGDLLQQRQGARTGLIVYAGSAHSVIPLTNDAEIIRNFLDALVSDMMPRPGKLPEASIPVIARMLHDARVPGTLLLMGDGASPQTATRFARFTQDSGHQLLVWGMGKEADQLPSDSPVQALQRDQLQALADAAGGHYQTLTLDDRDVGHIARLIDRHLRSVQDRTHPWVDAGYYLLFPFAALFLFWFRKGWTLQWSLLLLVLPLLSAPPSALADGTSDAHPPESSHATQTFTHWWLELWLTPDQQGRYYFEQGDFQTAAQRFNDPQWQAMAHYYNESFDKAIALLGQTDSDRGLFNLATAQAQAQHYLLAVATYDRLLARDPNHAAARHNRARVQEIIDDINRMSESQQPETGKAIRELGDQPQRADGAEKQEYGTSDTAQLSAEQILSDQRIQEQWMRQVQTDPSRFLHLKFQMQLERALQQEGTE
ncbi:VWA domain-containing protein [Aestuariirhabdus sp. Z084]|uniref:VWA domain-containing protein n=1 Tax=Aestuariirhabdus haliotis TaxID=2918751 RepID=UPI00201B450C|nr:VWA domain-containing protein [Aestuariirhabdus haliotis]MCL6416447.1 VWA domain-containing protein [Aestuariirhabdus haliotis]MCL6420386.1 VWA domain-containing protein [Aestuariirhabdus haliotis]